MQVEAVWLPLVCYILRVSGKDHSVKVVCDRMS